MKKIMSLAILASMILSASSNIFAEGAVANNTTQEVLAKNEPKDEVKPTLSWYNYQHILNIVKAHPYVSGTVGVAATVVAMYNYCSWFRKLIGMEDEEDARSPRLNSRLATAQRAY